MKSKILILSAAVAIAVVAMLNVNFNKSDNQSGLALANIEALADNDIQIGDPAKHTTQQVKKYIYDDDGRLSGEITYDEDCCVKGASVKCQFKSCGTT